MSNSISIPVTPTPNPQLSPGQDAQQFTTELTPLLQNGWTLTNSQTQLEKSYYFKTYTKVMDMHTCVGVGSKAMNHHGRMCTDFNSLTVIWMTHNPRGLSAKDTAMARYCDEQARLIGTVEKSETRSCTS